MKLRKRCRLPTVVVAEPRKYDETRLWWLLTAHGKRHVYILDGGYGAYVGAGLPTTLEEPTPCTRGTWTATPLDESMLATREQTLASRDLRDGVRLWDVRSPEEHLGTVTLPGAARPGR